LQELVLQGFKYGNL